MNELLPNYCNWVIENRKQPTRKIIRERLKSTIILTTYWDKVCVRVKKRHDYANETTLHHLFSDSGNGPIGGRADPRAKQSHR